jgi:hypothetical protein
MDGEGGGIVGNPHKDRATVGQGIINPIGDGHAQGVGTEVMIVDQSGGVVPLGTEVPEVANQFALFGVHADQGKASPCKAGSQDGDVLELLIAMGAGIRGELLAIDVERIIHFVEEASHGGGGDGDAGLLEQLGDLFGRAARPPQPRDRVAGGVVLQQEFDGLD